MCVGVQFKNNYKIYTIYIVITVHIKNYMCQIKVKISTSDNFIHPLIINLSQHFETFSSFNLYSFKIKKNLIQHFINIFCAFFIFFYFILKCTFVILLTIMKSFIILLNLTAKNALIRSSKLIKKK